MRGRRESERDHGWNTHLTRDDRSVIVNIVVLWATVIHQTTYHHKTTNSRARSAHTTRRRKNDSTPPATNCVWFFFYIYSPLTSGPLRRLICDDELRWNILHTQFLVEWRDFHGELCGERRLTQKKFRCFFFCFERPTNERTLWITFITQFRFYKRRPQRSMSAFLNELYEIDKHQNQVVLFAIVERLYVGNGNICELFCANWN